MTDAAIRQYRNGHHNKLIVWYLQPHISFVTANWSEGFGPESNFGIRVNSDDFYTAWDKTRVGELSFDQIWEACRANLEYVLEDVYLLLNNIDGKVVISADHGNAFGEWGFYGHPEKVLTPEIRRVPWSLVDGTDRETHTPVVSERDDRDVDVDVESRLDALGYK